MGVTDEGQCRNCMFVLKDQLNLDQMGLRPRVHARQLYVAGDRQPLTYFRFWVGVVAVDILDQRNQLSPLVLGLIFAQWAMSTVHRDLYRRVQRWHPWLPTPDIARVVKASREVIGRDPVGEAPITIGSTLLNWQEGTCDGVVVASPWSCAPGLVAESLLRHQRQIPLLFVYCDGTPLDEPRLNRFAFRLKRAVSAAPGSPASAR